MSTFAVKVEIVGYNMSTVQHEHSERGRAIAPTICEVLPLVVYGRGDGSASPADNDIERREVKIDKPGRDIAPTNFPIRLRPID